VNVNFDGKTIAITTDVNGFGQVKTTVPYIPGNSYHMFATSQGIAASENFAVLLDEYVTASNGVPLEGQYAAVGSTVTINIAGAGPYEIFDFNDTGLSTYNGVYLSLARAYHYGIISVTITNGSFYQQTSPRTYYISPVYQRPVGFEANANGVLTLTYSLTYLTKYNQASAMGVLTGSEYKIIDLTTSKTIGTYLSVTGAVPSSLALSYPPNAYVSFSLSSLLPPVVTYATPETLAWEGPYALYIDGVQVAVNGNMTFKSTPSGTATIGFTIPASITDGVHVLTVVAESGTGATVFADYQFIVSSAELSVKGATVVVNTYLSSFIGGTGSMDSPFLVYPDAFMGVYGIKFNLFDFPTSVAVTMKCYNNSGAFSEPVSIDSNGAGSVWFDPPFTVGNIPYNITFSVSYSTTVSGSKVTITQVIATYYYEDVPAASFIGPAPFTFNGGMPVTDFEYWFGVTAIPGESIPVFLNSLLPNTYYNVYLSTSTTFTPGQYIGQVLTGNNGDVNASSVQIPYNKTTGTYYIDFAHAAGTTNTAVLYLTVEVTQLTLNNAFPGQIVNIGPIPVSSKPNIVDYKVTVYLNGTAYKTMDVVPQNIFMGPYEPEFPVLYVSFNMPNGNPGNWYSISISMVPEISTTVIESITTFASASSFSPSSFTVYGSGTFSESGTATFTLPSWVTSVSSISGLTVPLTISTGIITSPATITSSSFLFRAPTLTVTYSMTFSVTQATAASAVVTVGTPSVTVVAGTGSASGSTPGSYLAILSYTTGLYNKIAEFSLPSGVTQFGNSITSFGVSGTTANNNAAVTEYVFSPVLTSASGASTVTANYSATYILSGWTSAPVTVTEGAPSITILANYSGTPSSESFSPASYTALSSQLPSGTITDEVLTFSAPSGFIFTSLSITSLTGTANPGSITFSNIVVLDFGQSGSTVKVVFDADYTITGGSSPDVITFSSASVSGSGTWSGTGVSLPALITVTIYDYPTISGSSSYTFSADVPTYATATSLTLELSLSSGSFSNGESTENLTITPTSSYSSGTLTASFSSLFVGQITDPDSSYIITVTSATLEFSFSGSTATGTSSPATYTVTFPGPYTVSGSATFNVNSAFSGINNFALNLIPGNGGSISLQNVVLTGYLLSGTTLTVQYSATLTLFNTLTVIPESAKLTYAYNERSNVLSLGTPTFYYLPGTVTLIQGNGAYIMGISSSQIADIVAAVNSAVSTSMQVPLSELNASIVAINNASAIIKSSVGTMTASLTAINATVQSINNGMATVKTDLNTIQVSLANLNATVLGIANNVVLLNTSIGQVETTLDAINANLVNISNGVMTIQTDAGKLMVSVSALNATVSSINGNVATLMTNAGKIMASLSALNATLASVNGTVVTINTNLGSVQTSLSSISSTVTSTASSVSSLQGSIATIQTSLGTISGIITSVNNGVATIQTSLGTLQTNVTAIKTSTASTSSSVSSTLGWEIGVLVLVIITLVLVLIVIVQVSRISKQFKPREEKKTPEEKTEEKKEGQ